MNIKSYVNISLYKEILSMTRYELAFCLTYFIIALIICTYSTPRGSLFSPDSIGYISDAENFLSNFPYYGHSTPIYPALIAISMGLGLTSAQSAGIVPIICYSLLGFPIFLIGKIISRPMTGYLSCIICLLCGKYLLWVSTYAWTEMPFIFFSALTILFLSIYNKSGYPSSIAFAELFTILAALTRSLGIVLIPVGIIIIIGSSKGLRNTLIHIFYYSFIPAAFTILWHLMTNRTYFLSLNQSKSVVAAHPLKLSFFLSIIEFKTHMEQIFYIDYKPTIFVISLFILICLISIGYKQNMKAFIKNTVPLTSYILLYSFILILVTANSAIMINNAILEFRYIIPIYPYIILLIIAFLIFTYDKISARLYKNLFKIISIFLLICLVAQGANSLYHQANGIRTQSLSEYHDKLELNEYISEYNITDNDVIYFDVSYGYINHLRLALGQRTPEIYTRFIKGNNSKTNILDNLTLPHERTGPASATSVLDLIRENKNHTIYLIAPLKVLQNSIEHPPNDICFINPVKFTKSFICMVDLKNNETCNTIIFPRYYLFEGNSSIKAILAGNFIGQKHDQLLISNAIKDTLQIIDFAKASAAKIEYEDEPGTALLDSNHSLLSGDFMGLGYDQALSVESDPKGDKIIIEDFSQGKSPAVIRYSEVLTNNSTFKNLIDAEDAKLAGDFLALGHRQVLFIDRNSKARRLVIADFTKGKLSMTKEISLGGDSARVAQWLDDTDLQYAGDFMGLGYSQVLFINRNHTTEEKEKMMIVDFSKEMPSIKYQENWGESSLFGGWLDADDTQLVGDFMGLGHSQVLLVNHGHRGGKIMIADFSKGKPPAVVKYWEYWDQGTIFQGWLDINDTRIAGDFKELGHSQVLFLNISINGSNATIVEFINGEPMITL